MRQKCYECGIFSNCDYDGLCIDCRQELEQSDEDELDELDDDDDGD